MNKKTIHEVLDIKLRSASRNDRSRIQRTLLMLKSDVNTLNKNYSERLYKIFNRHYRDFIKEQKQFYVDKTICSYLEGKCVGKLRNIKDLNTNRK
jgi:hypothetical protein